MTDSEEDGTRHFMVNVIEPQFNLHSEEANVSCKGSFSIETLFSLETFQSKNIIVHYGLSGPFFFFSPYCYVVIVHCCINLYSSLFV